MKKCFSLLGIVTILLVAACQKKPFASFEFSQENYSAGDSLILVNKSTLSNTYRWTLPFGGVLTSKDLRIKLDSNLTSGYYTFKLEAFSKNRKLVDEVEQTIYVNNNVNNSTGGYDVMFWANKPSNGNTNPITVTLNYETAYIQNLPISNAFQPSFTYDLASNYAIFLNLQKGKYSYSATQPAIQEKVNQVGIVISPGIAGNVWSGIIEINENKMIIKLPPK